MLTPELAEEATYRAARLVSLAEVIDHATSESDEHKAWLRRNVGPVRDVELGEVRVTIAPQRRFRLDLAQKLPAEWRELCTRTVIDPTMAKRVLPPELYDACIGEGTLSVRVR